MTARHFFRRAFHQLRTISAVSTTPTALATTDFQRLFASSGPISPTAHLAGWLALPFVLLAAVCGAAPERGREASLDLQGLRGGPLHVAGELLQIDARRNLTFEHDADGPAARPAVLSELRSESSDEGNSR